MMSCPICLESYTDPVVLPCGHSLCRGSCAKMIVKKARIVCPTCRATHWAPEGVKGLPKNYALQEVIEEKTKPEPLCPDHLDERVNLFCTQCYVPVCVRCCLSQKGGHVHPSRHKDHQVIPLDQMHSYIQGLLSVVEGYLKSRKQQEQELLESLAVGDREVQSDQCKDITDRLAFYERLLSECKEVSAASGTDRSWTKLPEFRLILQSLDNIPDLSHPLTDVSQDVQPVDKTLVSVKATKCFKLPQDTPTCPQINEKECIVGSRSVSVVWTYEPCDCVGYFTVYYETAIFTGGLCSDKTSVVVTEFGRESGQVTLTDLDPERRYKVSVTASNDLGESLPSEYLYCRTSATKPEMCLI